MHPVLPGKPSQPLDCVSSLFPVTLVTPGTSRPLCEVPFSYLFGLASGKPSLGWVWFITLQIVVVLFEAWLFSRRHTGAGPVVGTREATF